jgi:tetratricopeptide (TPR) repeat protein
MIRPRSITGPEGGSTPGQGVVRRRRPSFPRPMGTTLFVGVLILGLLGGTGCGHKKTEAQLANDLVNMGLAAQKAGNLSGALAKYREALTHDPRNKFAYFDIGTIDQAQGRIVSAESQYQLALRIDPDFESALFNLAIVETSLKNLSEAETLYRHVIEVDAKAATAYLNLGFLLKMEGKTMEGDAALARAIQLDPTLASRIPTGTPSPSPSPSK